MLFSDKCAYVHFTTSTLWFVYIKTDEWCVLIDPHSSTCPLDFASCHVLPCETHNRVLNGSKCCSMIRALFCQFNLTLYPNKIKVIPDRPCYWNFVNTGLRFWLFIKPECGLHQVARSMSFTSSSTPSLSSLVPLITECSTFCTSLLGRIREKVLNRSMFLSVVISKHSDLSCSVELSRP